MNVRLIASLFLLSILCVTETRLYSVECVGVSCTLSLPEGDCDLVMTPVSDISSKVYQCACSGLQKMGDFIVYWLPVAMSQEAEHPQAVGVEVGKPVIEDGIAIILTEAEKESIKQGIDSFADACDSTVQALKIVPEKIMLLGEQIVKKGLFLQEKATLVLNETVQDMRLRVFLSSFIKNKKMVLYAAVGGLAGAGVGYAFLPVMKQKDVSAVSKGVGIAAATCMGALVGMYCCAQLS